METAPSPAFAMLLRRYRMAAGLTQEELAERARLSVRTIGDLERGASLAPRKDTVELLAEALVLAPPERAALAEAARRLAWRGGGRHVRRVRTCDVTGWTPRLGTSWLRRAG